MGMEKRMAIVLVLGVLAAACGEGGQPAPETSATGGEPAAPTEAAPAARLAPSDAPAPGAGREIVAVVEGDTITAEELDDPIRIRLYDLERLQYETRLDRLQALAVEKILLPRAEAEGLSLEAFIAREAAAFDLARRKREGETTPAADEGEIPDHVRRLRAAERREAYVQSVLDEADLRILLQPPEPPRFDLRKIDETVRGTPRAPVSIVGFIDYQSPHARRAQPVIRRLLDAYDGRLNYAVRDLPMHFHRNARLAAEAARCAGEQGFYWRYHDLLFQNQDALERADLDAYARRLGMDTDAFGACLDEGRQGGAITAGVTEAARLGVGYVPTFFVNGLYLKGAQPFAAFSRLVDAELARLGLAAAPSGSRAKPAKEAYADAPASDLPLVLVGTLVMGDPDRSTASIRHEDGDVASTYRTGSKVMKDVELVRVERERVYLSNAGEIEYLPLTRSAAGAPLAAAEAPSGPPEERPPANETEAAEVELPPPDVILSLTREEVDRGLDDRETLEQSLERGVLDLDGQRLVKLSEVPAGSLYEKLGLEPGDVLMQVNGEWVTDASNPLWDALEAPDGPVTLRFMRDGFPRAVEYRIE